MKPFSLKPSASDTLQADEPMEGVQLYLPDLTGLECLPASGEITFRFKRRSLKVEGEDELSAQLSLTEILNVKCDPDEDDEGDPVAGAIDKLFAEAAKEEEEEDEDEEADKG